VSNSHALIDTASKILAILVIPLILWAVRLEVQLATAEVERQNLQVQVKQLSDDNASVLASLQSNTVALERLSEAMGYVKLRVDEIKAEMNHER